MVAEKNISDLIPKKRAALELFRTNKKIQNLGSINIIAVFATAISSVFSLGLGAITAGAFAVIGSWFLVQARKEMLYYNKEYDLGMIKTP